MPRHELMLCDMVVRRIAAAVMAAVVLTACGNPNERDLNQALKSVGCAMPESQYQQLPGRLILSISVMGCRVFDRPGGGSRLLTSAEATMLIEGTAWSVSTYRYDTLFVTNSAAAPIDASKIGSPKEISRDELKARFGQRDPALDTAASTPLIRDESAAIPWIVIPPLVVVLGSILFFGLVRAIRRGSIWIMWIIR